MSKNVEQVHKAILALALRPHFDDPAAPSHSILVSDAVEARLTVRTADPLTIMQAIEPLALGDEDERAALARAIHLLGGTSGETEMMKSAFWLLLTCDDCATYIAPMLKQMAAK